MDLESVVLGGFLATLLLTTLLAAAQELGWSRMSLPFLLGTMFTPDRHRAMVLGFALHFLNGWLFALLYAWIFELVGRADAIFGALLGFGQSLFVLITLMPLLPYLHPRMASEHQGPEPTRALEPPGFLALNYGRTTPLVTVLAHFAYGAVIGYMYRLGA
ncbi:MAG TPA: hypothetical protein VF200_14730 [Woeseiaceae bacterium]